jgi:hypothetical protein
MPGEPSISTSPAYQIRPNHLVRRTDPNGHLEMPGSRTMSSPLDHKRWYYANKLSSAVPDGLDDEEALHAIWADESAKSQKAADAP